jgi:hypothetical protein
VNSSITIQPVDYKGWPNCWRITNGKIEVLITADVGPRIIRFGFPGGQNLLKNFPEQMGGCGEPNWMIRGGSRIWIAPEDRIASYAVDNSPVRIEQADGVLIATAPVEEAARVQKQMEIRMDADKSSVQIIHRIRNAALLPMRFGVWVLTAMAPGGTGITGFPPRGTHPEDLDPTNPLVMWAFTNLSDPRWTFTKKYLALRQDPAATSPQKIGHFNPHTWAAYLLNNELFIKQYTAVPGRTYPDLGCSFETFTNADMLELETLGPLETVAPSETLEHIETWSLHKGVSIPALTDEALDAALLPFLSTGD